MNNIWDEFARYVFNVEVEVQGDQQPNGSRWGAAANASSTGRYNYAGGTAADQPSALAAAAQTAGGALPAGVAEAAEYAADATAEPPPVVETRVLDEHERIGRNDPCWCGSGKKFKKCHGAA
jgi:preprotein translocase subunit SecA